MDTKRLQRFEQPGHAVTGDRRQRSDGAGHEFAHSIVDDYSRLAYTEVLDDERAPTVTAFTQRALDWFLALGIVTERVMSRPLTVLGRRTLQHEKDSEPALNLVGAQLTKANLAEASLRHADLEGADLDGANLRIELRGAGLERRNQTNGDGIGSRVDDEDAGTCSALPLGTPTSG